LKTNKLYKYINLLIRILIGLAAIWYIYIKLNDSFLFNLQQFNIDNISYRFIIIALLLVILNWGIEAIKWRYAIRNIVGLPILKAFKHTITGITLGLVTPNRIGEIPARALLLNNNSFKEITLKTAVASFSQVLITLLIGGIGFAITYKQFNLGQNSILLNFVILFSSLVLVLLYFRVISLGRVLNKIKYIREKELVNALSEFEYNELVNILMFSLLRYIVFSIQFWLVLKAFDISLTTFDDVLLIPICFMIASFIPTILISEIGVRGSVALFVFGTVSNMDIQIILSSVLLWLINVALPALIGLINLNDLKILKEK